jgi:transposase
MVLRENVSVREAARRLRISRNTAAKWLNEPQTVEPRYPQRAPVPSLLAPYREQLANWLKTDSYRSKRYRRSVRTALVSDPLIPTRPFVGETPPDKVVVLWTFLTP